MWGNRALTLLALQTIASRLNDTERSEVAASGADSSENYE